MVCRYRKVDNFESSLFLLLITIRSGLLAENRWSVYMSKSHRSLYMSFSRTAAGLCIYHLFVWSNLNFLHIFQWIILPTQSCLVLYSFCACLLHSLIMWLIVSSLSPHNLHLLFCCILSILAFVMRKIYFYPKTGFYFRKCENGAGWHLIPYRISPRSEIFPRAHKNWHIM